MLISKSIVDRYLVDSGQGLLPGRPVKRVIMCISRLGILHFSVVMTDIEAAFGLGEAGRAVIEVVRSVRTRVMNREIMVLEEWLIYV